MSKRLIFNSPDVSLYCLAAWLGTLASNLTQNDGGKYNAQERFRMHQYTQINTWQPIIRVSKLSQGTESKSLLVKQILFFF